MAVIYEPHVQNFGWLNPVSDGALAGTTGQSLRLEAVKVKVNIKGDINVFCRACVSQKGWLDPVYNGDICGTVGESLAIEALQFQLTGQLAEQYSIHYSAHIQNYGYMNWCKDGELMGTEGVDLRAEGIRIMVLPKGVDLSVNTLESFIRKTSAPSASLNLNKYEKGIDVSEIQGNIDFNKVRQAGYTFVIIRASENDYIDPMFQTNVKNARKAGLKVGAYQYSHAYSKEEAVREAQIFLTQLKEAGGSFECGVWYDREIKEQAFYDSNDLTIDTWCSLLTSAGYTAGFYAGYYFTRDFIGEVVKLKWLHWLAQYNDTCDMPCYIWQSSEDGTVDGVEGNVDLDTIIGTQYSASPQNPVSGVGNWGRNFVKEEWICDCQKPNENIPEPHCDGYYPTEYGTDPNIDPLLIEVADYARDTTGAPLYITCGVRCPTCNTAVGGVPDSLHLFGHAFDCYSGNTSPYDLAIIIYNKYKDQGIGCRVYTNFLHVESGTGLSGIYNQEGGYYM